MSSVGNIDDPQSGNPALKSQPPSSQNPQQNSRSIADSVQHNGAEHPLTQQHPAPAPAPAGSPVGALDSDGCEDCVEDGLDVHDDEGNCEDSDDDDDETSSPQQGRIQRIRIQFK